MNEKINEYIRFLKSAKKVSKNTIVAYQKDLNDYMTYLGDKKISLSKVRKNTIYIYENHLLSLGKSSASVARALSSIRGFHQHLLVTGNARNNPASGIETPKIERVLPDILTVAEIDKLMKQPDRTNYRGYRDKAILELLYATGIRVSELLQLKLNDVDITRGTVSCTDRVIPFGAFSSAALLEYLKFSPFHNTNNPSEIYLFTNSAGKQLTRQGIWKIIKKHHIASGIQKAISPQILRNSFAAHLLDNGADIKIVQELMGHTALSSTLIYAELNKNRLREAYDKSHPRAKNN